MSKLGYCNCQGDKFSNTQRGGKGSQSSSTVSREEQDDTRAEEVYASGIMISLGWVSLKRFGTAGRKVRRGGNERDASSSNISVI